VPSRIDSRGRRKPLQRHVKPRKPKQVKAKALEVLACDTIERIRDGMRRYIVTFIDPVSHFAFAVGIPSKHARHTARALEQGLSLLPQTPKVVLSDNGSEFEADFAQLLEERSIKRWYTYPKNPKMNAHAERFNRTILLSLCTVLHATAPKPSRRLDANDHGASLPRMMITAIRRDPFPPLCGMGKADSETPCVVSR